MKTKVCRTCGTEKDISEFYAGRTKCKYCENKAKRKYREENKDKERERIARWRRNNKEKSRHADQKYYQDNKDKIVEYQRKYHQDNKESLKEITRKYYQDNKDKLSEYHRKYYQDNKESLLLSGKIKYKINRDKNGETIRLRERTYHAKNRNRDNEKLKQYRKRKWIKDKMKEFGITEKDAIIQMEIKDAFATRPPECETRKQLMTMGIF